MKMVAVLALLQGVFGILRAFQWFRTGADLMNQGLLLLPMVGVVAWLRGVLVVTIAFLFVVFAYGAWSRRSWATALGLTIAVVNILLVLSALAQGANLGEAILWLVIPVIIIAYLLLHLRRWSSAGAG